MNSSFRSPAERGAMGVADFCAWAGISRPTFYRLAAAGELSVRKIGTKTVVTQPDAIAWLNALPSANIKSAA